MLKKFAPFIFAILLTVPAFSLLAFSWHPEAPIMALCSGIAILGASFLLTWACDVAQNDMPQAVAIAVVAFIAVLPEYAVDMYFTWMAGQDPASPYSHYAIANMTGANRLLIGAGWSSLAIIFAFRYHHGIDLPEERRTDVLFLAIATIVAMGIPVFHSLSLLEGGAL